MIDEKNRPSAHRDNIDRYRRLLNLSEEKSALESLAAPAFPLTFKIPNQAAHGSPAEL